jgi:excisionase family DNA binding protein
VIDTRGYVTVAEAAERLHLSPEQVRRRLRDGQLKGERVGHQWFVDEESLKADSAKQATRPLIPPELLERIDRRREEIFKRNGVVFDVVQMLREHRGE